jgi:hypothetical protein
MFGKSKAGGTLKQLRPVAVSRSLISSIRDSELVTVRDERNERGSGCK